MRDSTEIIKETLALKFEADNLNEKFKAIRYNNDMSDDEKLSQLRAINGRLQEIAERMIQLSSEMRMVALEKIKELNILEDSGDFDDLIN